MGLEEHVKGMVGALGGLQVLEELPVRGTRKVTLSRSFRLKLPRSVLFLPFAALPNTLKRTCALRPRGCGLQISRKGTGKIGGLLGRKVRRRLKGPHRSLGVLNPNSRGRTGVWESLTPTQGTMPKFGGP